MRNSVTRRELGVEPLLLYSEEPVEVARAFAPDASLGRRLGFVPLGGGPVSWLAWNPWGPPRNGDTFAQTAAPATQSWMSGWKRMDLNNCCSLYPFTVSGNGYTYC